MDFAKQLADEESELHKFFKSGQAGFGDYFLAITEMGQEAYNALSFASEARFQKELDSLEKQKEAFKSFYS